LGCAKLSLLCGTQAPTQASGRTSKCASGTTQALSKTSLSHSLFTNTLPKTSIKLTNSLAKLLRGLTNVFTKPTNSSSLLPKSLRQLLVQLLLCGL
jgi:hypothetical protein